MTIMPVSIGNKPHPPQVNTVGKNNVNFAGQQDFTAETKTSHKGLIIAGSLIGTAILGFALRKPIAKLFTTKIIEKELKPLEKKITNFYEDLISFSGLKTKPKLEFVKKIDTSNVNGIIGSPIGFYGHVTHTVQVNTDLASDLHQVIFINKSTGKKVSPIDPFGQNKYITSNDISQINSKPDLVIKFMKQHKINPEEYDFSYKKLEGNELEAFIAKTILHELRHAYQKEIIHRTFGLETILEVEKESIKKTALKPLTKSESEHISTELKKGYKAWENCPMDIDKNSEEGQLAKKFLDYFKAESQNKSNYSTDPFEKDAYAYQYSDKVVEYIATKFGILKSLAQRI